LGNIESLPLLATGFAGANCVLSIHYLCHLPC
jgi:hypothetical protein